MDNELLKQFEDALHRAQMSSDKAEKDGDAVAARNHVEAARQIAGEMRNLLRAEHPEAMTLPSPTEEGARLAAEGTTSKEAFFASAGREGLDKPAMGMKQAVLSGVSAVAPSIAGPVNEDLESLAKDEQTKGIYDRALQAAHPIAYALGSAAPYAAVPGSAGVVGGCCSDRRY